MKTHKKMEKHTAHNKKKKDFILFEKKEISILVGTLILSVISSISLIFFTEMSTLESLRAVYGGIFVLFFPGFIVTSLFFKESDELEKIALSFALSIALVPLLVFYFNFIFGLRIGVFSVILSIILIITLSFIIKNYEEELSNKIEKIDNFIDKKIISKIPLLNKLSKK